MRLRAAIIVASLFSALAAGSLRAERSPVFGLDAFWAAVPPSNAVSTVFSPLAFEFNCATLGEGLAPLPKAAFIERLGVLTGWDDVYRPLMTRLDLMRTNGVEFLSARAFLIPRHRSMDLGYRSRVQQWFRVETCQIKGFRRGANSWFRARMEGVREDFSIPEALSEMDAVAFYDLESIAFPWRDAFNTNATSAGEFVRADGVKTTVPFMRSTRPAFRWRGRRFTLLELPMADDARFFAMLPAEGASVDSLRDEFSVEKFPYLLTVAGSMTETGVENGECAVEVPRFALRSDVELIPVLKRIKLPHDGFTAFHAAGGVTSIVESVSFRLDERGTVQTPVPAPAANAAAANLPRVRLERPFVFFIYHEPTRSIPVIGVYAGETEVVESREGHQ